MYLLISIRKHIFADLRPYICTFKDCDSKLFSSRSAWFEHEVYEHRQVHQCMFCKQNSFKSRDHLRSHLAREHAKTCPPPMISSLLTATMKMPETFSANSCPFCDDLSRGIPKTNLNTQETQRERISAKKFRKHVATHMEQLALFALPKLYNDDNSIQDPGSGNEVVSELESTQNSSDDEGMTSEDKHKRSNNLEEEEDNRKAREDKKVAGRKKGPPEAYLAKVGEDCIATDARGFQVHVRPSEENKKRPGRQAEQEEPSQRHSVSTWRESQTETAIQVDDDAVEQEAEDHILTQNRSGRSELGPTRREVSPESPPTLTYETRRAWEELEHMKKDKDHDELVKKMKHELELEREEKRKNHEKKMKEQVIEEWKAAKENERENEEVGKEYMRRQFQKGGYTEEEIERMMTRLGKKRDHSPAVSSTQNFITERPNYLKVHKKYIDPITLETYKIKWKWADVSICLWIRKFLLTIL